MAATGMNFFDKGITPILHLMNAMRRTKYTAKDTMLAKAPPLMSHLGTQYTLRTIERVVSKMVNISE